MSRKKSKVRDKIVHAYANPPGRHKTNVSILNAPPTHADLLSQHDIAREVGFLIMYCSNLEKYILDALTKVMRGDVDASRTIFGHIENLNAKLNIFFDIAERKRGVIFVRKLLDMREDITNAITFRNKCCHSFYGFPNDSDGVELISNLFSKSRGDVQLTPLKINEINAHTNTLKRAIQIIRNEIGGDSFIGFASDVASSLRDKRGPANPRNTSRQVRTDQKPPSPSGTSDR